ncbi:HYR-like domain-containing protein, partial [Psychroserpens damuponensis]
TDECGNTTALDQIITIEDNIAPSLNIPNDITVECGDSIDPSTTGTATGSDNCGAVAISYTDTANTNCGNSETITRTWTATDDCGNTTTLDQIITIEDTTAPTIDSPAAAITIQCDESGSSNTITDWLNNNGGAIASDTCGNVTWSNNYNNGVSDCSELITVIFTATDDCGNSASTTATYAIQDTTPPVISNPASNQTVECGIDGNLSQNIQAWLSSNGGATATDDCSSVTWSNNFTTLSNNCGETGSATVTFTATDGCGNATSTTATFNNIDSTNPVTPDAPNDLTLQCIDDLTAPGQLTASDNCMNNITVTGVDSINNANSCNIIITRTWTFIDDCGNSSAVAQNITIADTTAPTFTVPNDITINCNQDPNDLSNIGDVTNENDNCSSNLEATFSDDVNPGVCANGTIITRTWTLTDECG